MSEIIEEIRSANQNFMDSLARGDAESVAALYTADAKLLPPGSDVLRGRDAIRTFWAGAMRMGVKEAKLETTEVDTRENLTYEIGHYALTVEGQNGLRTTALGKYVVIWKSQEGRWRLHVDIWNNGTS